MKKREKGRKRDEQSDRVSLNLNNGWNMSMKEENGTRPEEGRFVKEGASESFPERITEAGSTPQSMARSGSSHLMEPSLEGS